MKLVSVVIPVWNGGRFLDETLASVLAQDYPAIEVIAVDDGSDDDTPDVLARWPAVVALRQPRGGAASARNAGCERARGAYVALQDADDLWAPHKLRVQIAHLEAHPEHGFVVAEYVDFVEPGVPPPAWAAPGVPRVGGMGNFVARREVLERVGPFAPDDGSALDWSLRAQELGVTGGVVGEVLLRRRIHDTNLSYVVDGRAVRLRSLAAALRRRRSGGGP